MEKPRAHLCPGQSSPQAAGSPVGLASVHPWGFLVPCGTPGQAPVRAVPIAPPAFFCHILGDTWGSCSVLHPVKTVFSHSVGVSVTVIAGVMI